MTDAIQTIKRVVAKVKSDPGLCERLADTADLIDDVGLDSLDMLQFMLEIEASLGVQIDFDRLEFAYLRSIRTLADFLATMPARPSAAVADTAG
jgi:acyl carrier protein